MIEIGNDPSYLGDGIYISTDGYHIILEALPHKIYLDPHVQKMLYEILKREIEDED